MCHVFQYHQRPSGLTLTLERESARVMKEVYRDPDVKEFYFDFEVSLKRGAPLPMRGLVAESEG